MLTTTQHPKEAGFRGPPALIQIHRVLSQGARKSPKKQYRALLQKIYLTVVEIRPYDVDKLTGDAVSLNILRARKTFPAVAGSWRAQGDQWTYLLERIIGMMPSGRMKGGKT